ncbi:MAG: glycosyltransferase [Muribaculum sp.]|nr:glycosyltransferase [Muribaculum sp.]
MAINTSTSGQKPRVLIANKFYYRRGGDCVYTLNLEQMLRANGHEAAVFAMRYPENINSPWNEYFPSEVSFTGGPVQKLKALERTLGHGDVRKCFARLLRDFKPDVVHLNNIHSYLSPVIAEMSHDYGAKVVWTLHDYKLVCPAYSCLRHGRTCQDCFTDPKAVLSTRCMKGSRAASAVAYAEERAWNPQRIMRSVDTFIAPSDFMALKMKQGGYDKAHIKVLNNFIDISPAQPLDWARRGDFYCYVGRLSPEKGIETLLKAAQSTPLKLLVAGDGPLFAPLKDKYADAPNITFLGRLAGGAVAELIRQARFSVVPSEWYENNPFSIIESHCAGTPVLGADIGGIPELIDSANGMLFPHGDIASLSRAIMEMYCRTTSSQAIADRFDPIRIQATALHRFSASAHYAALGQIYSEGI